MLLANLPTCDHMNAGLSIFCKRLDYQKEFEIREKIINPSKPGFLGNSV